MGWVYTTLTEAMEEMGLQEVETYVSRSQNTVAQFIATSPIVELHLVVERCPGTMVYKQL